MSRIFAANSAAGSSIRIPETALTALRPWLTAIARELLAPDLQAKFGASDIVQQTYIEAIRDLPQWRGRKLAQLRNWLLSLLQNNYRDANKSFRSSRKRNVALERERVDADVADYRLDLEHQFANGETMAKVYEAIGELPHAQQRMLHWRFSEELSYSQIAARVERSEDAVRMMISRTLNTLRERFLIDEQDH